MAELTVERNDAVIEPGGAEAGRVEHVIVNELTQQITDLVVLRKDGTEFMVPIGAVTQQGPGVFLLRTPPERLAGTHHFEPERFHEVPAEVVNTTPATAYAADTTADNVIIHATHDAVTATGIHGAATPMTNMPSTPSMPPMPSLTAHLPTAHPPAHDADPRPTPPPSPAATPAATRVADTRDTGDTPQTGHAAGGLREQITDAVSEQVTATKAQVTDAVRDTLATVKSSVAGEGGNKTAAVTRAASNVGGAASGAGNSLLDMVRDNPLPVALMGIGIGWLLVQHRSGGSGGSGGSSAAMYRDATSMYGRQENEPTPVPAFAYDEPDGPSARETLGNAAATATASVGQFVGQAGERVGTLAGAAGERVSDLTGGVSQGVQGAQSGFARTVQDNPMNIGIVALALGFAAGFLLPETPTENRLFGDRRDALLGQAQEQITKAQRVAQDMQKVVQDIQATIPQAVKESAQRQGLTGPT